MLNIVQAEFFRVNYKGVSLDKHMEELGDRIADALEIDLPPDAPGVGIKTVLRFYDQNNLFTSAALEVEWLRKRVDELVRKLQQSSWHLRRLWLGYRIDQLIRRRRGVEASLTKKAAEHVRLTHTQGQPIAVEVMDHSFRLVRPDEAHELSEIALRSKACWIFVFKPADLCFDNGTVIASVL